MCTSLTAPSPGPEGKASLFGSTQGLWEGGKRKAWGKGGMKGGGEWEGTWATWGGGKS